VHHAVICQQLSAVTRVTGRGRSALLRVDAARLTWLLLAALLITRTALSLIMISRPGIQYDEVLFVNAATVRIPGVFIFRAIHGVPLMVFPYIGALKSWLYDPVFAVFAVSPATIRLPVVLITSAGLGLMYLAVRSLVNRPVAILALVALCFDNSVFWLTRNDVGPSAVELFLKCAALWCVARFVRVPSVRWTLLLLGVLALGLFNKLNFIWVVNAAAAVSILVILRHRTSLRSHWRLAVTWLGGLVLIYAAFGAYYYANHIFSVVGGGHGSLGQPLGPSRSIMASILSGTWFYGYALGPITSRPTVAVIFALFFSIGAVLSVLPTAKRNVAVAGIALATLLVGFQILLTPQAAQGWHYLAIYPYVSIVAAYGTYQASWLVFKKRALVHAAVTVAAAVSLAYNGLLLDKYMTLLATKEPSNPEWSTAIYRLSSVLQYTRGSVFTADWGISNPLLALHPSRRWIELAFELKAPTAASLHRVASRLRDTPGRKLVVTHPTTVFPEANRNLFKAAGRHLHLVDTISATDGRPVFLIYAYR
jgi:hypothetical protein